ncbi:MAG: HlyD family type I secretion periplasmic adaptor subunit [Roseinatronobacter sp.]
MPNLDPLTAPSSALAADHFIRRGLVVTVALVFCLGAWAAFASISGAVIAQGRLKVSDERQVVQHLSGGVVAEIAVREGDAVRAGDLIIRLDDRRLRAELAIIDAQLHETRARIARLEAEQDAADEIVFPDDLQAAAQADPDIKGMLAGQSRLFDARRTLLKRELEQLRERQVQIDEEIRGLEAQRASLTRRLDIYEDEYATVASLLAQGLAQSARVLALDRERVQTSGDLGTLAASIAQARGRIAEIELQKSALIGSRMQEAMSQLRDLKPTEAHLRERRLDLVETIEQLKIRAPRDGIVLDMRVFALRAVIEPAAAVAFIVPSDAELVVDLQIRPVDIDQIWIGQTARIRFASFNQRTTPEVDAVVRRISPDALENSATRETYYSVELHLAKDTLDRLGGLTLLAGMPLDAFIETGARSPISYLVQPMMEFFMKAWREQ